MSWSPVPVRQDGSRQLGSATGFPSARVAGRIDVQKELVRALDDLGKCALDRPGTGAGLGDVLDDGGAPKSFATVGAAQDDITVVAPFGGQIR